MPACTTGARRNRPPIMRNINKRLEMCIPQGKHCWSSGLNCRNFESTPGVMRCMPTCSRAPSEAETCVYWCSSTSAGWLLPRGARCWCSIPQHLVSDTATVPGIAPSLETCAGPRGLPKQSSWWYGLTGGTWEITFTFN